MVSVFLSDGEIVSNLMRNSFDFYNLGTTYQKGEEMLVGMLVGVGMWSVDRYTLSGDALCCAAMHG